MITVDDEQKLSEWLTDNLEQLSPMYVDLIISHIDNHFHSFEEISQLKKENERLRELLELAYKDVKRVKIQRNNYEQSLINSNRYINRILSGNP